MTNKSNWENSCKEFFELSAKVSNRGLYITLTKKINDFLKLDTSSPVLTIAPNDNENEKNRFNIIVFSRQVWIQNIEEPLNNLTLQIRMVDRLKRLVLGHAMDVEITKRRVLKIPEYYYSKFLNINKGCEHKITIIAEIDQNQKIILKVKEAQIEE